jgi:hypothetical protein
MAGIIIGAVIGVVHAIHLCRKLIAIGHRGAASATWFAVWAVLLWTVLGPYVLAAWLIGALGLAVSHLRRPTGSAQ